MFIKILYLNHKVPKLFKKPFKYRIWLYFAWRVSMSIEYNHE